MKGMLYILMVAGQVALAQTAVNKSFPVQAGQQVNLHFDHPKLVKITTWDKNEISVTGNVMINSGENDDAFSITSTTSGNIMNVTGEEVNIKSLPKRITIHRDGGWRAISGPGASPGSRWSASPPISASPIRRWMRRGWGLA
jgi:hypothetical protein